MPPFSRGFRGRPADVDPARVPPGQYVTWCDGGYTTNLPLEDVTDGRAWIAYEHAGDPWKEQRYEGD